MKHVIYMTGYENKTCYNTNIDLQRDIKLQTNNNT